jgi:hypothetical protein
MADFGIFDASNIKTVADFGFERFLGLFLTFFDPKKGL